MLDIYIIRQSVYWTTGSFNYVYPLFMLFFYWYVLLKNSSNNYKGKNIFFTSLLAFLASASVEQGGMMCFGLTLLFFIYNFIIKNNKFNFKKYSIILISSLLGIISVIFSPAQFVRFGLENTPEISLFESMKNCFNFLVNVFIKSNFYNAHFLLLFLAILLNFTNIRKLSNDKKFTLISSIILGIGSQMMMLVSPVYGERNTLFGAFMIIVLTATLVCNLPETKNKLLLCIKKIFYISLILIATFNSFNIYKNYKLSNEIQNKNIELIKEYKKLNSNKTLKLSKLVDDRFGWSMPYISTYHEYWYKVYYEITNAEIIWEEYTK